MVADRSLPRPAAVRICLATAVPVGDDGGRGEQGVGDYGDAARAGARRYRRLGGAAGGHSKGSLVLAQSQRRGEPKRWCWPALCIGDAAESALAIAATDDTADEPEGRWEPD